MIRRIVGAAGGLLGLALVIATPVAAAPLDGGDVTAVQQGATRATTSTRIGATTVAATTLRSAPSSRPHPKHRSWVAPHSSGPELQAWRATGSCACGPHDGGAKHLGHSSDVSALTMSHSG
jgi:hypothetical protein